MEMSCVEQVAPNDPPTAAGAALGLAQVLGCQAVWWVLSWHLHRVGIGGVNVLL